MALLNYVIERFPYNTEAIAEKAFLVYSLTRSSPENEYWELFKQALEIDDGGYSRQYFYLAFIKSEEKEK